MPEFSGPIGSIGTYDIKADLNEVDISVGAKIPVKPVVLAWAQKELTLAPNAAEKFVLQGLIDYLQKLPA